MAYPITEGSVAITTIYLEGSINPVNCNTVYLFGKVTKCRFVPGQTTNHIVVPVGFLASQDVPGVAVVYPIANPEPVRYAKVA